MGGKDLSGDDMREEFEAGERDEDTDVIDKLLGVDIVQSAPENVE